MPITVYIRKREWDKANARWGPVGDPFPVELVCPNCENTKFQIEMSTHAFYQRIIDADLNRAVAINERLTDDMDYNVGDDWEPSEDGWACDNCWQQVPPDLDQALDEFTLRVQRGSVDEFAEDALMALIS